MVINLFETIKKNLINISPFYFPANANKRIKLVEEKPVKPMIESEIDCRYFDLNSVALKAGIKWNLKVPMISVSTKLLNVQFIPHGLNQLVAQGECVRVFIEGDWEIGDIAPKLYTVDDEINNSEILIRANI